jgi:HEAT repeat protein
LQRSVEKKYEGFRRFLLIPALACLLAVHCGTRPEERRLSIYDLKSEPTEQNVQRIRALFDDPDRDVRATALNALVGLGVDDAEALALAALDDPDGFVRATAAKLLGDLGNAANVEALATVLLSDPDPVARQRAAESLAVLRGDDAVRALARGLGDPMEGVRRAAVRGLTELDPGYARDDLVRLLHEDAVWEVRAEAAHALGLTGDPAVVEALQAALDDPNEFVRSAVSNALRLHEKVGAAQTDPGPDGVSGVY